MFQSDTDTEADSDESGASEAGRLWRDRRGIEGLPIRLVIALVVGVASLGVMLSMVDGIGGLQATELDARPTPEVTTPGEQSLTVAVVGEGEPVAGATVVVTGGSAGLDGPVTAETGPDGNATLTVAPTLGPNQAEGTLAVEIKPPADGSYTDRRTNTEVLVLAE